MEEIPQFHDFCKSPRIVLTTFIFSTCPGAVEQRPGSDIDLTLHSAERQRHFIVKYFPTLGIPFLKCKELVLG